MCTLITTRWTLSIMLLTKLQCCFFPCQQRRNTEKVLEQTKVLLIALQLSSNILCDYRNITCANTKTKGKYVAYAESFWSRECYFDNYFPFSKQMVNCPTEENFSYVYLCVSALQLNCSVSYLRSSNHFCISKITHWIIAI